MTTKSGSVQNRLDTAGKQTGKVSGHSDSMGIGAYATNQPTIFFWKWVQENDHNKKTNDHLREDEKEQKSDAEYPIRGPSRQSGFRSMPVHGQFYKLFDRG